MRSATGAFGLAVASLVTFVSAQGTGTSSPLVASATFNAPATTSVTAGKSKVSIVQTGGNDNNKAAFVLDTSAADAAFGADDYVDFTVNVPWPTGTVAGATFSLQADVRVTNKGEHYSDTAGTRKLASASNTACNVDWFAKWGPNTQMFDGDFAFGSTGTGRRLYGNPVKTYLPAPRDTVRTGTGNEYDTVNALVSGLAPLVVPAGFNNQIGSDTALYVRFRLHCPTASTKADEMNDFEVSGLRVFVTNPVVSSSSSSSSSTSTSSTSTTTSSSTSTTTTSSSSSSSSSASSTVSPSVTPTVSPTVTPSGTTMTGPTSTNEPIDTFTPEPEPETSTGTTATGTTTGTTSATDAASTRLPGPFRIGNFRYAGCVSSPPGSITGSIFFRFATRADNSNGVCISICSAQNKTLSGTFGADCYCGDGDASALSTVSNGACNAPCPGGVDFCGGRSAVSKRAIEARQAPGFGVLLTVYVFELPGTGSATATTTVFPPGQTGIAGGQSGGITINNVNNNVNTVNITLSVNTMKPVTCSGSDCDGQTLYEKVCDSCKAGEERWVPVKCTDGSCSGKPVCTATPVPVCTGDCWYKTPCTSCQGGYVYAPQPPAGLVPVTTPSGGVTGAAPAAAAAAAAGGAAAAAAAAPGSAAAAAAAPGSAAAAAAAPGSAAAAAAAGGAAPAGAAPAGAAPAGAAPAAAAPAGAAAAAAPGGSTSTSASPAGGAAAAAAGPGGAVTSNMPVQAGAVQAYAATLVAALAPMAVLFV